MSGSLEKAKTRPPRRSRAKPAAVAVGARPRRGRPEGRAAERRYPSARPHPRRHRARATGRRGFRHHRAHPARRRSASIATTKLGAARAGGYPRQPRRRPDPHHRRAFSYFSHLAEHRRGPTPHPPQPRPCRRAGSPPRPGSLAYAFNRAREAGIDAKALRDFFDRALVSPVLTAHPTEVRRKSTLTRELEIAALLDARERQRRRRRRARAHRGAIALRDPVALAHQHVAADAAEGDRRGRQRAHLLRLHLLPRTAAHPRSIEDELARMEPKAPPKRIASFLRVGSWIGGDRDGNPFVTAEVLRRGDAVAERARARALSRGVARARRRIVAQPDADARDRRTRSARRSLDGRSEGAARRALSAGDHRHLFAARQDRARRSTVSRRYAIR